MEKSISSSSTLKVTCLANKTSLWKIRKILTEKSEGWLDFDNNSDVEKYLFSHLSKSMINVVKKDPTKIKIDDYDTGYQQEVIFGYYNETEILLSWGNIEVKGAWCWR